MSDEEVNAPMNELREISGRLPCGCYARAHISATDGVTDEQALARVGGFLSWDEGHDREHAELCREAGGTIDSPAFWLDDLELAETDA